MKYSITTLVLLVMIFTCVCSKAETITAKTGANVNVASENPEIIEGNTSNENANAESTVVLGGSDSVVITPKKVTYKRDEKDDTDDITIRYPQISGVENPEIQKKIEETISYWKAFDTTLDDSLRDSWLYDLDYKVEHNKDGIFDILLTMSGVGAYPSESTKRYVINLKTGEQIKANDVFENMSELMKIIKKKFDAEVAATQKKEPETKGMFEENTTYTEKNLDDFSVSDKGITFHYDYEFAHVIQALQPPGEFFFKFSELKPYIKKTGAFGKFVK